VAEATENTKFAEAGMGILLLKGMGFLVAPYLTRVFSAFTRLPIPRSAPFPHYGIHRIVRMLAVA